MPVFVLVHSPSVGPATWQPVADHLRDAGLPAAVPSLLGVGEAGPPYWPRVVGAVASGVTAASGVLPGVPAVLVAHSNAGVFVPVVARGLGRPVACVIFADATIPGPGDVTPMVGDEFLPFLRGLAGEDGRLPPWTDWWDEADVAPMFPGAATREVISAEQPRLPLAYYLEQVPAPPGWDAGGCGYLLFSESYRAEAARARSLGWPVRETPGEHLHQVVDPAAVAAALRRLAAAAARGRPES